MFLCAASLSTAQADTCGDGAFNIATPDAALTERLCAEAMAAKSRLESCGLEQSEPIGISVVPVVDVDHVNCIAQYDCAAREVRLLDPERIPDALPIDAAYRVLPTELLVTALLAHELAHAFLLQTVGDADIALVDHEYIAAAMEYEALPARWRNALIAAAPVSLPPKPGLIAPMIYGLAPRKFATNAWQHFSLPENGCALIRAIAAGTVSFADKDR